MAKTNLRLEDYVPIAQFIKGSFENDWTELQTRFAEFDANYLSLFQSKLDQVKTLEQKINLTEAQKTVTKALYTTGENLNNELNFLSLYFKKTLLDTKLVSKLKATLTKGNYEGAVLQIRSLAQLVNSNEAVLASKGMRMGFGAELIATANDLENKNTVQHEKHTNLNLLHDKNKKIYAELYQFISNIALAGKTMYKGTVKAKEYTISKLLSEIRH